jgi:WD40 repeat protein
MLASGSVGGNVEIWRLDAGDKPQHILKAHPNDRSLGVALSFSPDGKFLATCSGLDKNAKIWSTESGDLVTSLPHTIPPTSVAFAPDGRTLYTADGDGKIRTWEAPTWKSGLVIVADLSKDQGLSLAPSPDGRYLAVGVSKRATIRVFELPSAGPPRDVRSWTLPCFTQSVSFAADSRHLAVPAVNGVIYLFRMGPAGS